MGPVCAIGRARTLTKTFTQNMRRSELVSVQAQSDSFIQESVKTTPMSAVNQDRIG